MATLKAETDIIERVLRDCVQRYATDDARMFTVFDNTGANFLVIEEGWLGAKRLYTTFVHVELREGSVWIQQDFTNHGIANDLVREGIPRECIVLAYKAPALRVETEFAAV
jgi:hypothetical protein